MASSQIRRCMRIARFLSTHNGSSSKEIHNEILADDEYKDVDLRQIQRDLRALEDEYVIESERVGRDNFWSLRTEWENILPETYSGHQLLGLYVLKSYLTQFKGTRIGHDVEELISKIEGHVSGDVYLLSVEHTVGQMNLARVNDTIILDSVKSIQSGNWVMVTYFNQIEKIEKTYPVFPCRLFTYNGELYLISYNPKYKNYLALALRNIKALVNLDFPPDDEEDVHHFDETAFTRERFGVFADTPATVKVQIDALEAEFFTNRNWHPSQTFTTTESGDVILEMKVPLSPELTTWILGWKQYVRVLEPKELIDDVLEYLERIRSKYLNAV